MYFSVVIPLYNKESYIARALGSVLDQTYANFEVIVVNDGSNDGSEEIVKQIADPRITLINQPNSGPSIARNVGIKAAQADFVCLLDADDVWNPGFLEDIYRLIKLNPQMHVFCLRHMIVDKDGSVLLPKVELEQGHCGVVSNFIRLYARSTGLINASSVCLRKDYLLSLGGFPENQHLGEDTYLWLTYALKSDIVFWNQIGSSYYRNSDNRSVNRIAPDVLPYYFVHFYPALKDPEFAFLYSAAKRRDLYRFLHWRTVLHISDLKHSCGWMAAYQHSKGLAQLNYTSGALGGIITILPKCVINIGKCIRSLKRAAK